MAKKSKSSTGESVVCIASSIGALIPDYTVDLLPEEEIETVQEHLLACAYCKQKYLTVLRVREAAQEARRQANGKTEHA